MLQISKQFLAITSANSFGLGIQRNIALSLQPTHVTAGHDADVLNMPLSGFGEACWWLLGVRVRGRSFVIGGMEFRFDKFHDYVNFHNDLRRIQPFTAIKKAPNSVRRFRLKTPTFGLHLQQKHIH